ncbi:MAG TPA: oligopeptide/dipeptide ABC transporter ATP-binding protein [Polyangiaceae bacterium]
MTNTPALLDVKDLDVRFASPAGTVRAVDGVSLELFEGETLALVGESGCGKSTLARAIVGLEAPASGSIAFRGTVLEPLPAKSRRALARKLQMVFQDPDASLSPRRTIRDTVGEPFDLHERFDRAERERRVQALLGEVGLDAALAGRYPHELSGGQKQRVCIARALAVGPELLVCDEAVSSLDVSVQAQILNLLLDLKASARLSYLFITHDLGVVRHIADRVAVMYLGEIVEVAPKRELFDAPRHPYTRALLASVPTLEPSGAKPAARIQGDVPSPVHPPSGCRFHTRCPEAFERCPREVPRLYTVGRGVSKCFLVENARREPP